MLAELLHQETGLVSIQILLLCDDKLSWIQRRKYCLLQANIFEYWEDYVSSKSKSTYYHFTENMFTS